MKSLYDDFKECAICGCTCDQSCGHEPLEGDKCSIDDITEICVCCRSINTTIGDKDNEISFYSDVV
jgi:hypothetical protein